MNEYMYLATLDKEQTIVDVGGWECLFLSINQ